MTLPSSMNSILVIISGLISAIATFLGIRRERQIRENTRDIVENKKAIEEVKRSDEVELKIEQASKGDEKALSELQRLSGE